MERANWAAVRGECGANWTEVQVSGTQKRQPDAVQRWLRLAAGWTVASCLSASRQAGRHAARRTSRAPRCSRCAPTGQQRGDNQVDAAAEDALIPAGSRAEPACAPEPWASQRRAEGGAAQRGRGRCSADDAMASWRRQQVFSPLPAGAARYLAYELRALARRVSERQRVQLEKGQHRSHCMTFQFPS